MAAPILLIVNKVFGRKPLRINPVIATLVFSESNLIPVVIRKGGITLAMAAIGNVGVDAVLFGVCHRGSAVIVRIGGPVCLLQQVWGKVVGVFACTQAVEH